ncbi:MAG: hypothetical protein HPY61_13895 [Methanotrichaceae archaeon]|nr:hypothetical protein [Methanotrichaceae archaeon]
MRWFWNSSLVLKVLTHARIGLLNAPNDPRFKPLEGGLVCILDDGLIFCAGYGSYRTANGI